VSAKKKAQPKRTQKDKAKAGKPKKKAKTQPEIKMGGRERPAWEVEGEIEKWLDNHMAVSIKDRFVRLADIYLRTNKALKAKVPRTLVRYAAFLMILGLAPNTHKRYGGAFNK